MPLSTLYLELAKVGTILGILHCVMFARSDDALLMFGADLAIGCGGTGTAIADLSPMSDALLLRSSATKR